MIELLSIIFSTCAGITEILIVTFKAAWNLFVMILMIKFTIFFFSNLMLFFVLLIFCPALLINVYGFFNCVMIELHTRGRGG
jgi:hypothetical protein